MLELLLNLHSVLRWLVLLVSLAALGFALAAAIRNRRWDALSERFSMLFPVALDIQVLVGVLVWVLGQRWSGDPILGWLHPVAMLGAVGLAHVGRRRSDNERESRLKGRQAAIFFGASLLVVLVAIPLYSWPI